MLFARPGPGQGQSTAKMHEAQNPRLESPTPRFEEASQNASAGRSFLFDETKFCTYYVPRSFTRSYALQRSQSLSPMIGDPAALDYIGTVNSAGIMCTSGTTAVFCTWVRIRFAPQDDEVAPPWLEKGSLNGGIWTNSILIGA